MVVPGKKSKASLLLLVPVFGLGAFAVYRQYVDSQFGLKLTSVTSKSYFNEVRNEPKLLVEIKVGHTGLAPAWWGDKKTKLVVRELKLTSRDGKLIPIISLFSPKKDAPLFAQGDGRYYAAEDSYRQVVETVLPINPRLDGGTLEATVLIVDNYPFLYRKVFTESKVYQTRMQVECHYDGC